MFGTIILDAYEKEEVDFIVGCLNEICSPSDNYGWASAGIYSFWDYDTKEILYIGLASDICVRFKQHNGLLRIKDNACKYRQIQEYFETHNRLGYTILVQSALSQPIVHRNEMLYRSFLEKPKGMPIEDYAGKEGIQNIKEAEGQLIEAYKLVVGDIPAWNKMGGNIDGRKAATEGNFYQIVKEFAMGNTNNFLVSKSTLRELAENATYEWFEMQLHGLRSSMLTLGISFEEALKCQMEFNPFFKDNWNRIIKEKYLEKRLIV